VVPYPDIEDQVWENYLGRGKWRKQLYKFTKDEEKEERKRELYEKKGIRTPQKKMKPLEKEAETLLNSAFRLVHKARLQKPEDWPEMQLPFLEVAFVGRSNVGKSSLLNRVCAWGTVARSSSRPGETRHAEWYRNRKVKLDVIDMPGYGYDAKYAGRHTFGPDTLNFVRTRKTLQGVYVLIDARHGFQGSDYQWLTEIGNSGPMKQIVLTKCDLVRQDQLIKIASLVRSDLEAFKRVERKIILTSSRYTQGYHDIRMDICRRCKVDREKPMTMRQEIAAMQQLPGQEKWGKWEIKDRLERERVRKAHAEENGKEWRSPFAAGVATDNTSEKSPAEKGKTVMPINDDIDVRDGPGRRLVGKPADQMRRQKRSPPH